MSWAARLTANIGGENSRWRSRTAASLSQLVTGSAWTILEAKLARFECSMANRSWQCWRSSPLGFPGCFHQNCGKNSLFAIDSRKSLQLHIDLAQKTRRYTPWNAEAT
ncbi:hypothetical protein BJX66DRAFT_296632 [Aspergillus keveii]|uniref:Uncharacterized protein n=1 Tax=Aspergillus keveii TaxID=714993 RepID=A0ABR4GFL4_9EURO